MIVTVGMFIVLLVKANNNIVKFSCYYFAFRLSIMYEIVSAVLWQVN